MIFILIITILLAALDQIIKLVIGSKLLLGESITLIPGFFKITLVHNKGAAWSILNNQALLLVAIGLIALVVVYFVLIKGKTLKKLDILLTGMLVAGIVGNLIDRIRFGYVVDYLDFNFFGYDYPIFNLADIFIVVSIIALIIKSIKEEKDAKVQSK